MLMKESMSNLLIVD